MMKVKKTANKSKDVSSTNLTIANLLQDAADEFANHGCNDFEMTNDAAHISLAERVAVDCGDPVEVRTEIENKKNSKDKTFYLPTGDYSVLQYLSNLFKAGLLSVDGIKKGKK